MTLPPVAPRLGVIWVYLESTPLLGLASTLVAWQLAVAGSRALGGRPFANPLERRELRWRS